MKLIVFGLPGSGKSTFANALGDRLQYAVMQYTPVPFMSMQDTIFSIYNQVIQNKIEDKFILDGFPIDEVSASNFDRLQKVDYAIMLDVKPMKAITRCMGRRLDAGTNTVYHVFDAPAPDEDSQRRLVIMDDDVGVDFYKRVEDSAPLVKELEKYYSQNKRLIKINGELQPLKIVEEVIKKLGIKDKKQEK